MSVCVCVPCVCMCVPCMCVFMHVFIAAYGDNTCCCTALGARYFILGQAQKGNQFLSLCNYYIEQLSISHVIL